MLFSPFNPPFKLYAGIDTTAPGSMANLKRPQAQELLLMRRRNFNACYLCTPMMTRAKVYKIANNEEMCTYTSSACPQLHPSTKGQTRHSVSATGQKNAMKILRFPREARPH